MRPALPRLLLLASFWLSFVVSAVSCDGNSDHSAVQHQVFFVGYVYDGATGKRLTAAELTPVSLKYRDKTIPSHLEEDGRFVTSEPLPTWQDYSAYVTAPGYRAFVSTNVGVDLPKSLQMTEGASTTSTVQTFDVAVRLFPLALKAPKVTITVEKADALVNNPPPARAAGTLRLTPVSSSLVEQGLQGANGVWLNDEDLLTQTVTKPFTEGSVEIAADELVYGVTYQIAIFDVEGYQPFPASSSSGNSSTMLSAGAVSSMLVTLQPDAKAALRILGTTADKCMPPLPTATTAGASVDIMFSEDIEPAGTTFAEDVDNGLSVSFASSASVTVCPLNSSLDATKQERGTKATIAGRVLTLTFNPSMGLAVLAPGGGACAVPSAFTAVVYNLGNVLVQPKGDAARKVNVGNLLAQLAGATFPSTSTTSVSCPPRPATTSP